MDRRSKLRLQLNPVFDRSDERHYGYGERDDGHDGRHSSAVLAAQKRRALLDRPFNVSTRGARAYCSARIRLPHLRSNTGMMMAMKATGVAAAKKYHSLRSCQ
jgi:hypothetical protein